MKKHRTLNLEDMYFVKLQGLTPNVSEVIDMLIRNYVSVREKDTSMSARIKEIILHPSKTEHEPYRTNEEALEARERDERPTEAI